MNMVFQSKIMIMKKSSTFKVYHKTPKNSYTRKIAVIILKLE